MPLSPSYDELLQKVRALEDEIAALRENESALKEDNQRQKDIIDVSFDGILIHENGKIIYANEKAAQYSGYGLEELVGANILDFVAAEDQEEAKSRIKLSVEMPDIVFGPRELRIVRKDKSVGYIENFSKNTLLDGKPVRIISFRDITSRLKAEEKLLESEKKYRDLVENISEVTYILDINGVLTYVSPASEKMLGYTPEKMIGRSPLEFIYKEDHEKTRGGFQEALSDENKPSQYRMVHKSGDLIWVQSFSKPVLENGRIIGIQGIVTNITEVKKAEEEKRILELQLQNAQRMEAIGTLAGGIAHDFNNILTAIIGYSEMVKLFDAHDESAVRLRVSEILSAANRAKELVQQILTFSRKNEKELKPVLIAPVVREALRFLRASLPSDIVIEQYIDDDAGAIWGDATQIHQIIMNLCTNAAYAMRENGGKLTIDLREFIVDEKIRGDYSDLDPGSYIRLEIRDTGHGITRELLPRIFDPFFTTKKRGEGTGMGLAVVYGIVESYKGAINVDSEPETGTRFQIFFPSPDHETDELKTDIDQRIRGGRECILFVDDEAPLVELGREILENLGYQVVARLSSVDALADFRKDPSRFDLVITDMTMPSMNGMELSQALMAIRPDIPIILCTGFSERVTKEKASAMGIREYLLKPSGVATMAETVRKALDN